MQLVKGVITSNRTLEVLKKIVARQTSHLGTPFKCPMGSPCYNWLENEWTRQLVHGLQKLLPAAKVTHTALMGQTWATDPLKCLGVEEISDINFFLVQRSP